ncbi:hypothetical protein A8M52_47480, partial [Escherichia coli]
AVIIKLCNGDSLRHFMTSVYALVKCFHEFHSEHPLIIALRFFIKSCNLLQSNNKIAKSSKNRKVV